MYISYIYRHIDHSDTVETPCRPRLVLYCNYKHFRKDLQEQLNLIWGLTRGIIFMCIIIFMNENIFLKPKDIYLGLLRLCLQHPGCRGLIAVTG